MNTPINIPDNVPLDTLAAKMLKEERATKLCMLADAIESIAITDDGSIKLSFRNNVIVTSNGHQVYYAPDNMIVHQCKHFHMNPIAVKQNSYYKQGVYPILSKWLNVEIKFNWYTRDEYLKKLTSKKEI